MVPIRATFEIKDTNNRSAYNQSINIDIDKPNSTNNSFTNSGKSPNNFIYSKINQNRVMNPQPFQQRSISPFSTKGEVFSLFYCKFIEILCLFNKFIVFFSYILDVLTDNSNKQNVGIGKTRLRSSSPAQNQVSSNVSSNFEERYMGGQKAKWKF